MSDRTLITAGLIVGLVTLYAVIAGADGEITTGDANVAAAFITGAGLTVLIFTGRKPKL